MKVTVQVIIESDEDALPIVEQIACVEREALTAETLGLTLHEAKTIVAQLQATLVTRQAAAYVTQHQRCPRCGVRQRCKGHHQIVLRSLFGKLTVPSPRLYTCRCQAGSVPGSWSPLAERLSERTTPERRYLEAKWAALLPYGVTVDLLEEVLPLQTNPASVYRHVQQVAERLEGELAAVPVQGITGDGDDRSRPGGPVKVGLDGGYVHARDGTNRKAGWFEMIVGVSTPSDRATKRFGFVSGYDTHAKRRLCRVLNAQGMELHQAITFLSDGGDTVRDLPLALSPVAEHVLDWFHIAMRLTVLRQQLKRYVAGVPALDVGKLDKRLEGIKWYLWHGNVYRARTALVDLEDALGVYQDDAPDSIKLIKKVRDLRSYVRANEAFIPNYGERYRYGEPISTAFVESGINQVISKRFVKKQQMRWTKRGAHLLLQVRTQELNGDLHATFCRWYPHMSQSSKAAVPFRAQAA